MDYVLPGNFLNDSERRDQVSIILSSLNYRGDYFIHLKRIALRQRCEVLPIE